uniref:Phospholipase C like 1 (inactive) n=1 Tax=Sus scrofa TaxID=9823 RepID=A0A8D1X927_PIG
MSAPVPSGWTLLLGVPPPPREPETRSAMAEGAAGREGPSSPEAAGGEDDPRVGLDAASGDCVAAAPGDRWRDRRSGVALPGAAGTPADSEAGLLETARATPRRSSIIKVLSSGLAQS